jgi:hypothetical protein
MSFDPSTKAEKVEPEAIATWIANGNVCFTTPTKIRGVPVIATVT